jgi:hypothetical protein
MVATLAEGRAPKRQVGAPYIASTAAPYAASTQSPPTAPGLDAAEWHWYAVLGGVVAPNGQAILLRRRALA